MALIDDLKKVGTFLVTELTTELVRKQKKASGRLIKSFRSDVKGTFDGFEISVLAESYFRFVDEGVNGVRRNRGSKYSFGSKKPPIQPILDWVKIKSIATGDAEAKRASFAIQTYIWKNGIKGLNILEETLARVSDEYIIDIKNSYVTKLSFEIDNILKNDSN